MKLKTVQDLEAIDFLNLPQKERLDIILNIVDESGDITDFINYFPKEDIKVLKENAIKETQEYMYEDQDMTQQEKILIQHDFEFSNQDTATQTARGSKSHIQYTKDLGGDGFTLLHIFLKPDGTFTSELQEFLYEDDGSQYDQITKEYVEEGESLKEFLNRI
jgi:hypothetical protein